MLTRTQPSALGSGRTPFYGAWLINRLPFDQIQYGSLTVQIGEHQRRFIGEFPGLHAELVIHQPLKFIWLFSTQGELGFAKAYADRVIDSPCLHTLLRFGADNEQALSHTRRGYDWFYQKSF